MATTKDIVDCEDCAGVEVHEGIEVSRDKDSEDCEDSDCEDFRENYEAFDNSQRLEMRSRGRCNGVVFLSGYDGLKDDNCSQDSVWRGSEAQQIGCSREVAPLSMLWASCTL